MRSEERGWSREPMRGRPNKEVEFEFKWTPGSWLTRTHMDPLWQRKVLWLLSQWDGPLHPHLYTHPQETKAALGEFLLA